MYIFHAFIMPALQFKPIISILLNREKSKSRSADESKQAILFHFHSIQLHGFERQLEFTSSLLRQCEQSPSYLR